MPDRRHWPTRLFHRRRPALPGPLTLFDRDDSPFTPETCPGLSLEECAILNTPLEDLDPEVARLLFGGLAQCLAEVLPQEAGPGDPAAILAMISERLSSGFGPAEGDVPPAPAPDPTSAMPADAQPEEPAAPPPRPIIPQLQHYRLPHGTQHARCAAAVAAGLCRPRQSALTHRARRTARAAIERLARNPRMTAPPS